MSGFVKIYGQILKSSVWVGQPAHLRLTWFALLVLADRHGNVMSSLPGLAQDAGVTVAEVMQALDVFRKPDPFSRTPDHEGRRIVDIDGGWHVLNHLKYREMRSDSQVKNAERQAKFKAKKRAKPAPFEGVSVPVTTVTGNASNDSLCTLSSVPDQSLEDPDQSDPDPIVTRPAKAGPARATPLPPGVFDAPLLQAPPSMTFDVPESWSGPKDRHVGRCAEFALNVADEAERFRLTRFRKEFPATEAGIDRRFDLWLLDARKQAEVDRGKALQQGESRRGRMPTNGVAQLQADEGRTGLEALALPALAPERPRRATRR